MPGKIPNALIDLVHHRWSIPILALLHEERGAKFVTLRNRLGVPRDSLTKTLAALMERGYVMRNPGYGHPMRPEYILTPRGERVGAAAPVGRRVGLRKWMGPVALVLAEGPQRFSSIRDAVPGVTPRALTATLKEMLEGGLLRREVAEEDFPPTAVYRLTRAGGRLAASVGRLADALTAPQAGSSTSGGS